MQEQRGHMSHMRGWTLLVFYAAVAGCWFAFDQHTALAATLGLVYFEHRFSENDDQRRRQLNALDDKLWLEQLSLRFALEEFLGGDKYDPDQGTNVWSRALKRAEDDIKVAHGANEFLPKPTPPWLAVTSRQIAIPVVAAVAAWGGWTANQRYGDFIFFN